MLTPESPLMAPVYSIEVDAVLAEVEQLPPPSGPALPTDPEHARRADAVFSQEQKEEAQVVAGLFGLWTGTLLLHDLAKEHFAGSAEEDEIPPRPRKELPKKG